MKFCNKCGAKVESGKHFCTKCGTVFETEKTEASKPVAGVGWKRTGLLMKSKRAKVTLASILAAGIVFVLIYTFIGRQMDPQNVAEDFIAAIEEVDTAEVQKIINEGTSGIVAGDSETEQFTHYLKFTDNLLPRLEEQLLEEHDSPIASITYLGKKWLLFDQYGVEIKPYYVHITPVAGDGEFQLINDLVYEDVEMPPLSDEETTFGPFLPGEHYVEVVFNGEYGTIQQSVEVSSSDAVDDTINIEMDFSENYISLYSNVDDAVLYVNGSSTGKKVGEINELGPVPLDGTVTVYAKKGTKRSDEVKLDTNTRKAELIIDDGEQAVATYTNRTIFDAADEKKAVGQTIRAHYENISQDRFAEAYDLFSSTRKSKVSMDGWTKGLQENMHDDVTTLQVRNITETTASAYIEMTSYDRKPDGSTLVQNWGGSWTLVKENGRWTLHEASLEKLSSRIE